MNEDYVISYQHRSYSRLPTHSSTIKLFRHRAVSSRQQAFLIFIIIATYKRLGRAVIIVSSSFYLPCHL